MESPFVSIIVPTYNRAESLRQTLGALAQQTYTRREVVVVDDGSTDHTREIVRCYANVHYLFQSNRGPAAARNAGARHAQGDCYAFTDDDCVPARNWAERIALDLQAHPVVAGVGGPCRAPADVYAINAYARYEWRYERGMLPPARYIRWLTQGRLDWRTVWPGTGDYIGGMDCPTGRSNNVCYRSDIFRALNGFDESFALPAAEDADFKIRLCLAGCQLLWDDSLLIEHRHAYTALRFRKQHLTYGRGVLQLERKYRCKPSPRWRGWLRLCKRTLALPLRVLSQTDREVAWRKGLADLYDAIGQLSG